MVPTLGWYVSFPRAKTDLACTNGNGNLLNSDALNHLNSRKAAQASWPRPGPSAKPMRLCSET